MIRKLTLLAILLTGYIIPQTLMAQEYDAPNYQMIKKQISNSKSTQYYPRLMERYQNCDSLLTNEDYRLLYYGFSTREDFIPYQEKPQSFYDIRRQLVVTKTDSKVIDEAIRITDEILENNPFDMAAIVLRSIAFLQKGDSMQYNLNKIKLDGIAEAITSSGDGETVQSAFHIIDIEHEYEITSRLGLSVVKDSVISPQVEYLRVEVPNGENIDGIYFNFDACGSNYRKKYE